MDNRPWNTTAGRRLPYLVGGGGQGTRPGKTKAFRLFPGVRRVSADWTDVGRHLRRGGRGGRSREADRRVAGPQWTDGASPGTAVDREKEGSQGPGVSGPGGSNDQGTAPRRCRSCKEKLWVRMRLVTSWVRSVSPKMSS